MICKICNSNARQVFTSKILRKYDVKYFKCDNCGHLFTEEPFWLDEAYSRSINLSDTGLLDRNMYFSKVLSVIIFFNFNNNGSFLDYAGGYGVFTRLMRDIGFDFYWHDPYTQNLFANGFEGDLKNNSKYELLTAFEVFEHLVNPKEELEKMLQLSDTIIFSTEVLPKELPDPNKWWYYGFEHGQHISFYSKKTIVIIARHFNLNYYRISGLHILTKKRINAFKIFLNRYFNIGFSQLVKKSLISKIQSDFKSLKR